MIRTKKFPLNLEAKTLGDLGENNFSGEIGVALKSEQGKRKGESVDNVSSWEGEF